MTGQNVRHILAYLPVTPIIDLGTVCGYRLLKRWLGVESMRPEVN